MWSGLHGRNMLCLKNICWEQIAYPKVWENKQTIMIGTNCSESSFNKVFSRQPFCKLLFGQLFCELSVLELVLPDQVLTKSRSRHPFCKAWKLTLRTNFLETVATFSQIFLSRFFLQFFVEDNFCSRKKVLQTFQFVVLGQGGWSVQVGLGGPGGPGGKGERGSRWSEWLGGQHGWYAGKLGWWYCFSDI